MKKLIAIILLVVYGLSSSGMTVQFHYCCGKLKDVSLSPSHAKSCGMMHSMTKKPCCDDRQVVLKLKADQKAQAFAGLLFSASLYVRPEAAVYSTPFVVAPRVVPEVFAPPPLHNPLYLLNCVYRI